MGIVSQLNLMMSFFNPPPPPRTSTDSTVLHETWPCLVLPAIGPNSATFASISNAHYLKIFSF
jgi:hypothetical protein